MNQPLSRLPGHAYAPGAAPPPPGAEADLPQRIGATLSGLSELLLPLLATVAGALTLWVLLELARVRRNLRRRARLPGHPSDWTPPPRQPLPARRIIPRRPGRRR